MALNAETTERNKSRYRGLVPFPKGKSGNPGGRTKQFAQCQRLCREASPDAARRLIELIQSEDERVALMAADKVFERAWGRPKDYDPNTESIGELLDEWRKSQGRRGPVCQSSGCDQPTASM